MKLTKRECPLKIEFCNIEAGWLDAKIKLGEKEIKVTSSYINYGIDALLEAIHGIHPNSSNHEYSNLIECTDIKGVAEGHEVDWTVPYKAEFCWDEEPSIIKWYFEHKPTLENEFDLNVRIVINRETPDEMKFTISYKDFCYALAKGCTEMLKNYGLFGFHHSHWNGDINIRHLLFIKAIALDAYDMVDVFWTKYSDCSDLNKEIELLMFDM